MKLILVVVLSLLLLLMPATASAEDGCGLLGGIFGCDKELQQQKFEYQQQLDAARIAGDNQAYVMSVETQRLQSQLNAMQAEADAQARAQIAGAQAASQVEIARTNADLEIAKAQLAASIERDRALVAERTAQLNAATGVQIANLNAQARIYQSDDFTMQLLIAGFIAVALATGGGFAAWQWRRGKEYEYAGAAHVLPQVQRPAALPSSDMQAKMKYLEDRGVAYSYDSSRRLLSFKGTNGVPMLLEDKGENH